MFIGTPTEQASPAIRNCLVYLAEFQCSASLGPKADDPFDFDPISGLLNAAGYLDFAAEKYEAARYLVVRPEMEPEPVFGVAGNSYHHLAYRLADDFYLGILDNMGGPGFCLAVPRSEDYKEDFLTYVDILACWSDQIKEKWSKCQPFCGLPQLHRDTSHFPCDLIRDLINRMEREAIFTARSGIVLPPSVPSTEGEPPPNRSKQRKRARKLKFTPEVDDKLVIDWNAAHKNGTSKKDFATQHGKTAKEITQAQSRVRIRRLRLQNIEAH